MNYFSIAGTKNEKIVLFHGTGGNEYSLLQIAGDLDPEAAITSFIGDVGEGAMRRFFEPLVNGRLDRTDFNNRVNQMIEQWKRLALQDSTIISYSNGANFVLGMLEKEPNLAKKIILMHPTNLNYAFEAGSDVEIIITAGALDTMSIAGDTMKLKKQLEEKFPHTSLKLFDQGHEVTDAEIDYLQSIF